jgi:hypothetical protein
VIFTRRLRDDVRNGRITCSVRVWQSARVKTGGTYPMEEGHIVVDSIREIAPDEVTTELARRSGFASIKELMEVARHGAGTNVYVVEFHYVPPADTAPWDVIKV